MNLEPSFDDPTLGCALEFFSASHGKWIAVDIIERDASGAVQVSAKPGTWISAKDCKRKLRTRVYVDDPAIGSTITSADVFLQSKACEPQSPTRKTPTSRFGIMYHQSCESPVRTRVGPASYGGSLVTNACEQVNVIPDDAYTANIGLAPSTHDAKVDIKRAMQDLKKWYEAAPRFSNKFGDSPDAGYHGGAGGISPTAFDAKECLPKSNPQDEVESTEQSVGPVCPPCPPKPTSYSCPHCGVSQLPTFESAVQHCVARIPKALAAYTVPADKRRGGTFSASISGPTIMTKPGEGSHPRRSHVSIAEPDPVVQDDSETDETRSPPVAGVWRIPAVAQAKEGREHSNADVGGETDSTRSSEGHRHAPEKPSIEAIAYNLRGEPIITRTVSSETGAGITTVINDDGTKCTFGKNTLTSLMSSGETDAGQWIESLTVLEVRGLVHEIGQVLLSTSALYQFHLKRLEDLSEKSHYSYFGLAEDATDKEIDMAYRKLAKQMHPDKNGGTPEAKEAFQQMKEKYEALKQHRVDHGPGKPKKEEKDRRREDDDSEKGDSEKEDGDDGDDEKEPRRKEAYDEDDEDPRRDDNKEKRSSISYDPTNQEELANTAVEMLSRLKAIEGSMATVVERLRAHGEQVVSPV